MNAKKLISIGRFGYIIIPSVLKRNQDEAISMSSQTP